MPGHIIAVVSGLGQRQFPAAYLVSSAGPAGTVHSSRMGVYLKEDSLTSNNRPVYKLDTGGMYLYNYRGSYWVIGPVSGNPGGGYYMFVVTSSATPPATGTWYYKDGNMACINALCVSQDNQLTVAELSG